jgi:hypothetical protein
MRTSQYICGNTPRQARRFGIVADESERDFNVYLDRIAFIPIRNVLEDCIEGARQAEDE